MKKILNLKMQLGTNKTLKKIIYYMLVPCLIFGILTVFMLRYSINQQTVYYKSTCISSINTAFCDVEDKMKSVLNSSGFLSYNTQFVSEITKTFTNSDFDKELLDNSIKKMKKDNKYIDNVVICDKASNTVYCDYNIYDYAAFFDAYRYADYPTSYWSNYRFPISESRFLSPTTVTEDGNDKNIVPLVYTRFESIYFNKIIIININLDKILSDIISDYPITVVNKQRKTSFSALTPGKVSKLSPEMADIILKNTFYTGNLKINNRKHLFVYNSPSRSILGYSYYSVVPYSLIYSKIFGLIFMLISLFAFAGIAGILAVIFGSRRIFAPIAEIADSLGSDSKTEPDTLKYITEAIQRIKKSNSSLDIQYQDSLSKIQKLYLINLLNSDEDALLKNDIVEYFSFKNRYFCSCIYQISPNENLAAFIGTADYTHVISELFVCIKEEYFSSFDCVVLPSDYNILYILLNVTSPALSENIKNVNSYIRNILKTDSSLIDITSACGRIYEGLAGLKKSHREAIYKINKNIKQPDIPISVNVIAAADINRSQLDLSDETTLLNYLVSFKISLANDLIGKILDENISRAISENELRKLYIKIITIITNVFDSKKIEYNILNSNSVLSAVPTLLNIPLVELHDIITTLLNQLQAYMESHRQQLDITNIINYIEENYNTDLYLDGLAEIFQTSPKYLSKLIKTKLGVSFVEYLNEYRIKQAMKIIQANDIKVTELYSMVGFNNRNTFSKAFKKFTGMAPNEYKKSLKNDK